MALYRVLWLAFGCAVAPCAGAGVGVVGERASIGSIAPDDRETTPTWEALDDPLATGIPMPLAVQAVGSLRDRFGADATDFAIDAGIRHGRDLLRQRFRLGLATQRARPQAPPVGCDVAIAEPGPEAWAPTNLGDRLPATTRRGPVLGSLDADDELAVNDTHVDVITGTVPTFARARALVSCDRSAEVAPVDVDRQRESVRVYDASMPLASQDEIQRTGSVAQSGVGRGPIP